MKYLFILTFIAFVLQSCTEKVPEKKKDKSKTKSSIVTQEKPIDFSEKGKTEVIDNLYIEYYPGGKRRIKFQGKQDVNKQRDGVWLHFSYEGTELSMTTFDHGKKHGRSLVKYPNGNIHYLGEYKNDLPVGIWQTYTNEGVSSEKDYGSTGE